MLRDEIARYTELSGNDGEHTPIGIIGAYLDGYEKGLESRENIHGEWIVHPKGIYAHLVCNKCLASAPYDCKTNFCPNCGARMKGGE